MHDSTTEFTSPQETLELYRQEASTLAVEYLLAITSVLGLLDIVESARDRFPELDDALTNLAPELDTLLSRIPSPYREETQQLKLALHRLDLVSRLRDDDAALLTTLRSVRGDRRDAEASSPTSYDPDLSALPVN